MRSSHQTVSNLIVTRSRSAQSRVPNISAERLVAQFRLPDPSSFRIALPPSTVRLKVLSGITSQRLSSFPSVDRTEINFFLQSAWMTSGRRASTKSTLPIPRLQFQRLTFAATGLEKLP